MNPQRLLSLRFSRNSDKMILQRARGSSRGQLHKEDNGMSEGRKRYLFMASSCAENRIGSWENIGFLLSWDLISGRAKNPRSIYLHGLITLGICRTVSEKKP